MHHEWLQWQEDAGLDSQLEKLRKIRKYHKINIYCLQFVEERLVKELACLRSGIAKEKILYHKVDEELAEIDGRKSTISGIVTILSKEREIKKMVKKMSPDERKKLLEMLKG